MTFDPLIANPGRLTILTALLQQPAQDFVTLRGNTRLTDGNLTTHARKLASAGMVAIEKSARAGKPVTTITLTDTGRQAFERHVHELTRSIRPVHVALPETPVDEALPADIAGTLSHAVHDLAEPAAVA